MIPRETCIRLEFDQVLAAVQPHARSQATRERIAAMLPLAESEAIEAVAGRISEICGLNRTGISLAVSEFDDIRPHLEHLRPVGALLQPVDLLAFIQVFETISLDGREVDENIRAAFAGDESVAFATIEPLDRTDDTFRHFLPPSKAKQQKGWKIVVQ